LFVHAGAVVGDGQHDVRSRTHGDVLDGVRVVEDHRRGLNRQPASLRHGVACVDDQIHEDLLELSCIGNDCRPGRRQLRYELDVLADQTTQHLARLDDEAVHVEKRWLEDLLAAKGEQLAREPVRPLGRVEDLVDVLPPTII
jgi:hypothetical protein